jgi:hypothetical protein
MEGIYHFERKNSTDEKDEFKEEKGGSTGESVNLMASGITLKCLDSTKDTTNLNISADMEKIDLLKTIVALRHEL